jgi:nucleoid-associated protein YgaU
MTFSAGVSVGGSAVGAVGGAVGAAAGAVGGAVAPSPAGAVGAAVGAAVGVGVGVASALGALIPASIFCTDPSSLGVVPFDFNPEKIQFTRSANVTSYPSTGPATPTGSSGTQTKKTEPPTISINDILFEGLTTKWRCDQLLKWLSLSALDPIALAAQALGLPQTTNPPEVTFMWGPPMVGFFYDVRIKQCTINYERFMPMGIPIRAKVTLQMVQVPSLLSDLPTNPTSGGVGGRRTHLVTAGDSLPTIAMQYYGRPGLWRRIAAVNRIDNPSRIRPGETIYLPGMGELTESAP